MMEVQGQILSIQHNPRLKEEIMKLRAEIIGFEWLVENLKQEVEKVRRENDLLRVAMMNKARGGSVAKGKKTRKGKLQPRKGWVPPAQRIE